MGPTARRIGAGSAVLAAIVLLSACSGQKSAVPASASTAASSAESTTAPVAQHTTSDSTIASHSTTSSDAGCAGLVSSWNAAAAAIGVKPLNPAGWTDTAASADFLVPASDGRATPGAECGVSDATGASIVLTKYALNDSGDWDAAYYYAVRFTRWTGSSADAPHTAGGWRYWIFSSSNAQNQTLTSFILTAGSTMLVGDFTAAAGSTPSGGGGGGTGRITAVATFAGGSPPCSGADVIISGPGGYSDSDRTGSDGRVEFSGLTPGTYSVTGSGQGAVPQVNGGGAAAATVTVTAGGDTTVQFRCI